MRSWILVSLFFACSLTGAETDPSSFFAKSGFQAEAEGLFLKPDNSNLEYASVITVTDHFNFFFKNIPLTYQPGFAVGIGYLSPDRNNLFLRWTRLRTSNSDAVVASSNQIVELPFFIFNNELFQRGQGEASFRYDAVDLDTGLYEIFKQKVQMRFFAGLRYAEIKRDLSSQISNATTTLRFSSQMRFAGAGPRFGIDALYAMAPMLGLVADVAIGGLISITSDSVFTLFGITPLPYTLDKTTRAVPVVDAKLALQFMYKTKGGTLIALSGGYQLSHYFNAFTQPNIYTVKDDGGPQIAYTSPLAASFQGPYFAASVNL